MNAKITAWLLFCFVMTISLPMHGAERTKERSNRAAQSQGPLAKQGVVSKESLEKNLDKVISVEIIDLELRQAIDLLGKELEISLVIDPVALAETRVDLQQKTTLIAKRVRLRSALKLLFEPLYLTTIHKNDVLMIISVERAAEELITKVYDCTDLLSIGEQDDDWSLNLGFGYGSTGLPPTKEQIEAAELRHYRENLDLAVRRIQQLKAQLKEAKENRNTEKVLAADFDSLIDLITSQTVLDCWLDNGGQGTISGYMLKDKGLIVVSQTKEGHEQIEQLFSQMRNCLEPVCTDRKK